MNDLLKHNIVAYLNNKYRYYAEKKLTSTKNEPFINKTIHEFIVLSPDLRADIDYNYSKFDKVVGKDLDGKSIKQAQKYLQKGDIMPLSLLPECIVLCTGVLVYNDKLECSTALNIRPYCNLDFIDYINTFVKHILSGTYIPYSKDIFVVTNDNIMDYLNTIFASYLHINPDTVIEDLENATPDEFTNRISESIRTFLQYYQKMENSQIFYKYVEAFVNELQSNQRINDYCKDYLISRN